MTPWSGKLPTHLYSFIAIPLHVHRTPYTDNLTSILSAAKLSTIAMTPAVCGAFCGELGYAYGGINFGTYAYSSSPSI